MNAAPDPRNHANFGTELRAARLRAGVPHAIDLASVLGVSEQTVNRWERGERRPQRSLRPDLADALFMTVAELDELLGTRTPRPTATRGGARSNVVAIRSQPDVSGNALPTEEARSPLAGEAVLSGTDLAVLRHEFMQSVVRGGLADGYARDAEWIRAAVATARTLGLAWEPPEV